MAFVNLLLLDHNSSELRFVSTESSRLATYFRKNLLPFSDKDIVALLEACQGANALRDRASILCLLDSGLRAAEFVSLNVGDVGKDGLVRVHGKDMKDRYTRLGAKARKAMLKYTWRSARQSRVKHCGRANRED